MPSRLLNVRLDDQRVRKVRRLRDAGTSLSDLVREAIDARFESLGMKLTGAEAGARVSRILERYPDPTDLPARTYDVHDARRARAGIRRALARRRR